MNFWGGKIKKRLTFVLGIAVLLAAFMPPVITRADGATIGVNDGTPLVINGGSSIIAAADGSSGIPITARGLPELGSPEHGFAAFEIWIHWDPSIIRLDSIVSALNAKSAGWNFAVNTPDNTLGTVGVMGWKASDYNADDIVLLYLGITAVGDAGDSTEIGISVVTFGGDYEALKIPVTPVSTVVRITGEKFISISPVSTSISAGATQQFTAIMNNSSGSQQDITGSAAWSSTNSKVATIDAGGLAAGLSEGTTTLVAEYQGIRSSAVLNVTGVPDEASNNAEETPAASGEVTDTPDKTGTGPEEKGTPVETGDATEPAETSSEGTAVEKPAGTTDTDADTKSDLPIVWIIVGAVAAGVILGIVGFSMFTRRRY